MREALIERETLLRAMPHISWPMRFVVPYHKDMRFEGGTPTSKLLECVMPWMRGRRPAWLVRLGLFLYDTLGGRQILPGTRSLSLTNTPEGTPLRDTFVRAFEYSDCWVDDARLVVLNAQDAAERGARILTRTRVMSAKRTGDTWLITVKNKASGQETQHRARALVNAGGPWVGDILSGVTQIDTQEGVRLVRGSHIVTRKLYEHDKCYFFQGKDGRIIFAIPYENDFTLIGTTDADHDDPAIPPECSPDEQAYLCEFASEYFKTPVTQDDIVWTYSGVRPLYDDGAKSATAATRDYVLKLDQAGAPLLNIFGGKITTYRRLAESAVRKFETVFPQMGENWTAEAPLAGGDFEVGDEAQLTQTLKQNYPFLSSYFAARLIRTYGTQTSQILNGAGSIDDLGRDFGATLTEREVQWLILHEFAQTAEDVVWRRTKLGLKLNPTQIAELDTWIAAHRGRTNSAAAE